MKPALRAKTGDVETVCFREINNEVVAPMHGELVQKKQSWFWPGVRHRSVRQLIHMALRELHWLVSNRLRK